MTTRSQEFAARFDKLVESIEREGREANEHRHQLRESVSVMAANLEAVDEKLDRVERVLDGENGNFRIAARLGLVEDKTAMHHKLLIGVVCMILTAVVGAVLALVLKRGP